MEEDSTINLEENFEKKIFNSKNIKLNRHHLLEENIINKITNKIPDSINNKITKIKFEIKKFNDKKKSKKVRNPGIDAIRLIGMFGIVISHVLHNRYKGAIIIFHKYSKNLEILHILSFWHINGFALISGIIGNKSNKYSNLLYLWMQVVFYSVGIFLYFKIFSRDSLIYTDISKEFFPIIFKRYWYFTAYFGMYLYLPIINKGISILSHYEYRIFVISILGIFVFWRSYKNPNIDVFCFRDGFSSFWLLTYYLIGAYIGKYRNIYFGFKNYIFCSFYLFIFLSISYLYFKANNNQLHFTNSYLEKNLVTLIKKLLVNKYDSVLKIIQSITISLFLLQINYNAYISKIICFLGPLVFGIYLIHSNYLVEKNIISKVFENTPQEISLNSLIILILSKSLKIFIVCIIIDYLRYLLFFLLRIRKICSYLEIIIKE